MSEQRRQQISMPFLLRTLFRPRAKPPAINNKDAWPAYWQAQGQTWRTEPEIDTKRQKYLAQRRAIVPSIVQGIYPFKGLKLSRADLEWLLATHEDERGPVDWSDENQRNREGLDLRGVHLEGEDLMGLPLAKMRGGVNWFEPQTVLATGDILKEAEIHLQSAYLDNAHLEGALLFRAHLESGHLQGAHLEQAILYGAVLAKASLYAAHIEDANLSQAHLQGAMLTFAHFERTPLHSAHLERADLSYARLEGADLYSAHLEGAILNNTFFDGATRLNNVVFSNKQDGNASLVDVQWGDANIAVIDWSTIQKLGNEVLARRRKQDDGKIKGTSTRLSEHREAVRANRQLSVALRNQGLNEEADHFAYRAQVLQRCVFRLQIYQSGTKLRRRAGAFLSYLFSWFLDLLSGYGYQPWKSILVYFIIIFVFMGLYLLNSRIASPHLTWDEGLVLSVSSFHGRGFFTQSVTLGDTYARIAATEAVMGLIVEVSFIATFTQRFFGR